MQLLDQPLSAYWKLAQDTCTLNEIYMRGQQGAGPPHQRH